MSVSVSPPEDSQLKLLLIEDDPIFRLGLRVWLNQLDGVEVIAEAENGATALEILAMPREIVDPTAVPTLPPIPLADCLDLVILDVSLGRSDPTQIQGLLLCQQIKTLHSQLKVLLLSRFVEPVMLAAAQQAGADGYCPKDLDVAELADVIRQVVSGQPHWSRPQAAPPAPDAEMTQSAAQLRSPTQSLQRESSPGSTKRLVGPFALLRRNLRLSGVAQIDEALARVTRQLQNLELSDLERAILAGQQRELRTARWLVNRLLATPKLPPPPADSSTVIDVTPAPEGRPPTSAPPRFPSEPLEPSPSMLATRDENRVRMSSLQTVLFDAVMAKLQSGLQNRTDIPLEIDILREEKKRELLYLVLRKLEDLLDELRYSRVQPEQFVEKRSLIFQDLWRAVLTDFFGRYYTVLVDNVEAEVVTVLQAEAVTVQTEILDKIPFAIDLLAHLLFQTPLGVDGTLRAVGSPEAVARAEILLDHLLIQVANAVVQPLLNRFANIETIKQNFYDRRLMSSREIERFRNNLSWRYRTERFIKEPKAIFESQHRLFTLQRRGIYQVSIYAPRNQELEDLSGVQFVVTLALEARDAIAPRVRTTIGFVGSGLIYVLTEVVGRGIGLIGRGILKGIGTAWQDGKFSRNGERQK